MLTRLCSLLFFVFSAIILALVFFSSNPNSVLAQAPNCVNVTPRYNGLLSAPSLDPRTKFGSLTGNCVIDPFSAGIVSFKIPTYAQLKNTYFERKASITTGPNQIDKQTPVTGNQTNLDFHGGNGDKLIYITGDLIMTQCADSPGPPCSGTRNAVIFVDGDLLLGDMDAYGNDTRDPLDIIYDNPSAGIVYIIQGDVKFGRNVRRFDGIIIAQGEICTSVDRGGLCLKDLHSDAPLPIDSGGETNQLTINGNLISLNSANPIQFQRDLLYSTVAFPSGNDTTPAEIINVQPKFLVVMKDLLSETYSIQTEDTHYAQNQ